MVKLFQEKHFKSVIQKSVKNVESRVNNLNQYTVLNESVDKLTEEIYRYARIKKVEIDFDNPEANVEMVNLSAKNFPAQYDVRPGKSYPCAKINYTFTVKAGDISLLSVSPFKGQFTKSVLISVSEKNFTIHYQTFYGNEVLSDEIKKEVKNSIKLIIGAMKTTLSSLNEDIEQYNEEIKPKIENFIKKRKESIQTRISQNDDLSKL